MLDSNIVYSNVYIYTYTSDIVTKMVNCFNFNCLVVVLSVAATVDNYINAAAVPKNNKSSCSLQLSAVMECEGAVQMSPEAAKIIQRKGQALRKCAPNYPQECVAGITKLLTCVYEVAKNAKNDTEMSAAANKSLPVIDKCFAYYPASPTQGVDQLFKPAGSQYHLGEDGQQKKSCADHDDGENGSGVGGTTPAAAGGNKASSPNMGFDGKKCAETKEQRQCIDKELSRDSEFVQTLNQLIANKKKCSEGLSWLCTPNTPDQKRCVAEASKPCVDLFMKRLFKCIGASYSATTTTTAASG